MPRQRDNTPTRRLKVTACEPFRTYTDQRTGQERQIYRLRAETDQGQALSVRLRSFDELPVDGQLREYRVRRYDHEHYGTSYTLSPAAGLAPRVAELERRVTALGERVHGLEQRPSTNGQPAVAGSRLGDDPPY